MKRTLENVREVALAMVKNTQRLAKSTDSKEMSDRLWAEVIAIQGIIDMMEDSRFLNDMADIYGVKGTEEQ